MLTSARWGALVAAAVLAGSGCGGQSGSATPTSSTAPPTTVEVAPLRTGYAPGSTPDSVLNGIVQPPTVLGFLRGVVVGEGVGVEHSSQPGVIPTGWTDYTLRVTRFAGPGESPYRIGSQIRLRVAGGSVGGTVYTTEGEQFRPLAVGESVYVLVREQGDEGGGNTADRVVASTPGQDLFFVDAAESVSGEGFFSRFREPAAAFEARFTRR